jgi:SAM-dependent methyltransferase
MKTLTESDLTMPRRKPRSLVISLAYRFMRIARALFGAKSVLRFFLNTAWLAWRFAFELSSDVFGSAFQTDARGVSDELLGEFIPPGATVLDAGCGPGRWTRIAARHAAHVTGVDASPVVIEQARRDTAESNVEYVVGDVRDVIARRHFDVALLVHVLEHIDDPDAFLRMMSAAVGVLVIEVPNFEADALNPVRHSLGCRYYTDADHVREYTPSILREQLLRNDLELVRETQNRGSIIAVARRRA